MDMKIARALVFLFVIIVFFPLALGAAVVRVSWLANSDADLAGYRVYYGTSSGSYDNTLDAGLSTSVEIEGLAQGDTYYFAVTAYDTSGNESAFSEERSISIPLDSSVANDNDNDGIPDYIELSWGLDTNNPMDSMLDTDGDGFVNLVEYMSGTNPLDPDDRPDKDVILKDFIAEVDEPISLSSLNQYGSHVFQVLTTGAPMPENNMIYLPLAGKYLYNVLDQDNNFLYRLRISVATEVFNRASYTPGVDMVFKSDTAGVSFYIPGDALQRSVPIGIGHSDIAQAEDENTGDSNCMEFDILPLGLDLAKGAAITVSNIYDLKSPVVQIWDDQSQSWLTLNSTDAGDGNINFETKNFGHFRLISEGKTADSGPAPSNAIGSTGIGGGGGGGGCFITTSGM